MNAFWVIFLGLVVLGGALFLIAGQMESSPNPDTATASAMPGIGGIACWFLAAIQIIGGIIYLLVKGIPA